MKRPEEVARARRELTDQGAAPHDDARAGARQLLVVRVEEHGFDRAALEEVVPALDDLLERRRLAVVGALDVEDGEVEEPAPRRRGRPRQQQVLGHEQDDAHGAEDRRRAAHLLAVQGHRPAVGAEPDLHLAVEPAVLDARRELRPPSHDGAPPRTSSSA